MKGKYYLWERTPKSANLHNLGSNLPNSCSNSANLHSLNTNLTNYENYENWTWDKI